MPRVIKSEEAKEMHKSFQGERFSDSFFPSSIGLGSGVLREGHSIDGLFDMGELGFIELGPVTIDPQH